ncbi:hypothetical protein AALC16_24240 [Lachnospiraceae bacterium 29-91]
MGIPETKRPGKERRAEETAFGRERDSQKLMERFGCSGYIQKFYDFLQGKFHPENILENDCPDLSKDQAWHVIYCMQEYFGIFDDRFERCKKCDVIFDSYEEGTLICEDTEPIQKHSVFGKSCIYRFKKEEYGHYCEECRPD